MKSNCLIWALCAWWKDRGLGYLLIRKSRFGLFPHFLYLRTLPPDADVAHFIPVKPTKHLLPPIWFEGRLARCDKEKQECSICNKQCRKVQ